MKYTKLLLLLFGIFIWNCSSSDDASNSAEDSRYKFLFTNEGNISFIGDQTNAVIKRALNNSIDAKLGYFFNETTNNLKMITRSYSGFYNYQISRVNVLDVFNNTENSTYYEMDHVPLSLDAEEQIVLVMFQTENKFSLLTKIYPDDNYRVRIYVNDNLTETLNFYELTDNLLISYDSFSYAQSANQLLFKHSNNSGDFLTRFDVETWQQIGNTINFNKNIFRNFGANNQNFYVARGNNKEALYTIEANLLGETSDTFNYIGGASIGYDTVDQRFEYAIMSDGRNETGIINTSNGSIERSGVNGPIGFNESPLFFFNE